MTKIDVCSQIKAPLAKVLGKNGLSSPINHFITTTKNVEHEAKQTISQVADTYDKSLDIIQTGLGDSVKLLGDLLKDTKDLAGLALSAYSGYISAIIGTFILPVLRKIWSRTPVQWAIYLGMIIYGILVLGNIYNVIALFA